MLSISFQLDQALAHQRAGRVVEAESTYRHILAEAPDHPDATHLLGMILQQRGQPAEAARLLGRSAELDPLAPHFHANLGSCLARLGHCEKALYHLREAVRLQPNYPLAWRNLGLCL